MEELSQKIFGTPDYVGVLETLAGSDALVKEFRKQAYRAGYMDKEGRIIWQEK